MTSVAIIGATGYTGIELVRLLCRHPQVQLAALTSRQQAGKRYSQVFPGFLGAVDLKISDHDLPAIAHRAEFAFLCLPHSESQDAAALLLAHGLKVVDLSADFRLRSAAVYRKWYGPHRHPDLLPEAVYGLPEVYRDRIADARLVANPGCYPTSVILGLLPLAAAGLLRPEVIADSKSGVSGAGRSPHPNLHFAEVNEGLRAYSVYAHRHTPEIEQEVSAAAGNKVRVTFVPHLVPMNRGILSTLYVKLRKKLSAKALFAVYAQRYENEPFVRVLPRGTLPDVAQVRGTNLTQIGLSLAPSGREAVVIAALDNLVKGAAGAAVQNFNLMAGLPETTGLEGPPLFP
jgi:N-acetyl-gamma-glutamyl-phosphate reductase